MSTTMAAGVPRDRSRTWRDSWEFRVSTQGAEEKQPWLDKGDQQHHLSYAKLTGRRNGFSPNRLDLVEVLVS